MIHRDTLIFRTFCFIFWLASCISFIGEELIPPLDAYERYAYLLTDPLTVVLGLVCIKGRKEWALLGSLLLLGLVSMIVNRNSFLVTINGLREFLSMLFFFPIVRHVLTCSHSEQFRGSLVKQLKVFLWLQAFCVTEQFIRYGANDHGGGTLGYGGSGDISMSIILLSFYFVTRNWDNEHYLLSIKKNALYLFLLFPVLLNETKASFVLLAIYLILLYKPDIRSVGKMLMAFPAVLLLFIGLFFAYIYATGQDASEITTKSYAEKYLVGQDPEDLYDQAMMIRDGYVDIEDMDFSDLPRFMKVVYLPVALDEARGGLLLGVGLGQFKGRTFIDITRFAKDNFWMVRGTVFMLIHLVIELGILGLIWFFFQIYYIVGYRHRYGRMAIQVKLFMFASAALILVYNGAFRFVTYTFIFCSIAALTTFPPKSEAEEEVDNGRKKIGE